MVVEYRRPSWAAFADRASVRASQRGAIDRELHVLLERVVRR
jgi:hypothetical protein